MSTHVSGRNQPQFSPRERALLVALGVAVITAGALLWAVSAAPAEARMLVAIGGGAAAVLLAGSASVAAYHTEATRRVRARLAREEDRRTRLEREARRLAEDTLPRAADRLREGQSSESALAGVALPRDESLRRLVEEFTRALGDAERRSGAAVSARSALEDEVARLVEEAVPALAGRMRAERVSAESALAGVALPRDESLRRLVEEFTRALGDAERKGSAAMAACASAAARVQAQVTSLLARLRELEEEYGAREERVFAEFLDLDHRVSQMGRLADSFALLSGGRSGRRWTRPIPMESIVRGAMGRINAYRRVRMHSTSTVAVAGYAAEGVMHALAELMDNATTFSAHGTEVYVYVEEEDAGVMITIEDSGLGMRPRERRRAEKLVSAPLDLTTLSGTRLGLAVVGRLAGKYGMTVNFRPSSRGGTGVVVLLPHHLITQPRQETGASPSLAAGGAAAPEDTPALETAVPAVAEVAGEMTELPKRRRGETLAAAERSRPEPAAPPRRRRDPAAGFAAFRNASGYSSRPPQERER